MTIVLVHGAWAGAWSWRDTARLLRKKGYDVYAPSMTGIAERAHLDPRTVNLSSHVADIAGLLRYEELENVLIVGHSYGGMVITGAVDREPQPGRRHGLSRRIRSQERPVAVGYRRSGTSRDAEKGRHGP